MNKKEQKMTFGTEVRLNSAPLYRTSTYPDSHRSVTGTFYLYDGVEENGRFKIVTSKRSVRFKPESMVFEGWIRKQDIPSQE